MKGTACVAAALLALVLTGSARPARALGSCRTSQLHVWVTHAGAAAGTVGGYLAFTNRGFTQCRLTGWPTLTAVRPGASTTAVRVRETMFGPYVTVGSVPRYVRGVPAVRLRHGQSAVAAFTGSDVYGPGETSCPPAWRRFRVTPPGNVTAAVTRAWIAGLGQDMPSCSRIEVSMVVPSSDLPPRG